MSGRETAFSLRGKGISTPCGGHGNCGRCKVRVAEGSLPVMTMDKVHLTEAEVQSGIRLACQAMPKDIVMVEII